MQRPPWSSFPSSIASTTHVSPQKSFTSAPAVGLRDVEVSFGFSTGFGGVFGAGADGGGEGASLRRARVPRHPPGHGGRPGRQRAERSGDTLHFIANSYSERFADASPGFDPARVREVRLVFDRTFAGTVILDEVGFSRLDPAFMAGRVPATVVGAKESGPR